MSKVPDEIKPEHLLKTLHSFEGRLAQLITNFSGSMFFVYFHVGWFALWVLINHNVLEPYLKPFDPFPYGLLTMVVSLEAIFLSTFIMISQNRQAILETYRELEADQEEQEVVEEVEDIQKDLEDIKNAMFFIQQKITNLEKTHHVSSNGSSPNKPPTPLSQP